MSRFFRRRVYTGRCLFHRKIRIEITFTLGRPHFRRVSYFCVTMSQPLFCWKKSVCSGLISLAGLGQLLHGLLPRYLITALTHQSHGHTAPFTFTRRAVNSENFAERTALNRQRCHVICFLKTGPIKCSVTENLTKITKITQKRIKVHRLVLVNFRLYRTYKPKCIKDDPLENFHLNEVIPYFLGLVIVHSGAN